MKKYIYAIMVVDRKENINLKMENGVEDFTSKCSKVKIKIGIKSIGRLCSEERKENIRKGNLGKFRKIRRQNPGVCDFGCGNPSLFYFNGSDKWCCSKSFNSCPENKRKNSLALSKVKRSEQWKKNIGNSNRGKIRSKEVCEFLRQKSLKYWKNTQNKK